KEKPLTRTHRFQTTLRHPPLSLGQRRKPQIDRPPAFPVPPSRRKEEKRRTGPGAPENDATITADARPAAPAAPGTEQSLRSRPTSVATPTGHGRRDFDAGHQDGRT